MLALLKLTYLFSSLLVSMVLIHKIEKILFLFLWGKNHKVKKTVIINKCVNDGLGYTDVESKIWALKAAWIPEVKHYDVLNDIVHLYLSKIGLDLNTMLRTNFKNIKTAPLVKKNYRIFTRICL